MIQISKILKTVPIFRMLGKESIDFIVERLKFKTYEAEETVCKVGDPGDTMFIIISGGVKICIYSKDEKEEQVVANLGSGDYFGEMALLTGETRSASVITTEPSEMFLLYKNDFDVILERFPSISLSMGKIVSKRLRETLSKAADIPKAKTIVDTGPKGSLKDKQLIDLITFCENNSLTGDLTIKKGNNVGVFEYENGELLKVYMDDLKDDEALDEMLHWNDGNFEIKSKPLKMDAQKKKEIETKEIKTILIVSNSLVVRKVIERAFRGLGYNVFTSENIQKTKDAVEQNKPDIIITDIKLSDGSGIDLCRSVKAKKDIPFIFLADDAAKPEFTSEVKSIGKAELAKTHEVSEIVKLVENLI